jgi:dipeptidase D
MRGGHSGVDIHRQRANAIQVLGRVLHAVITKSDLRVSFIHGGTVSNAIPRDAEAIVFLPDEALEQCTASLSTMETVLRTEFYHTDPELRVTLEPHTNEHDNRGMTPACSKKVIAFLLAVPHGVAAMATDIDDLVETSNNFATATVEEGTLKILTSQRSSVLSRLLAHTDRIEAIARLAGGEAHSTKGYPAWEANWDSPLIDMCQHVSQQLFQKPATISIIHGGLECGIIADKYPDMEAISFGPTIQNAHSPDERLEIGSIGRVWDLLLALLQKLNTILQ